MSQFRLDHPVRAGSFAEYGTDQATGYFVVVRSPGSRSVDYDAMQPAYTDLEGALEFLVKHEFFSREALEDAKLWLQDGDVDEPAEGANRAAEVVCHFKEWSLPRGEPGTSDHDQEGEDMVTNESTEKAPGAKDSAAATSTGGSNRVKPLEITVSEQVKTTIAKHGPYKLFGHKEDGGPDRRHLDKHLCIERFDEAWRDGLRAAIDSAQPCTTDEVLRHLTDKQKPYCHAHHEHREFRLMGLDFFVELAKTSEGALELLQLWSTRSSDHNPCVLFVKFKTIERRERWSALAEKLQRNDDELALQLLEEFMSKVERLLD